MHSFCHNYYLRRIIFSQSAVFQGSFVYAVSFFYTTVCRKSVCIKQSNCEDSSKYPTEIIFLQCQTAALPFIFSFCIGFLINIVYLSLSLALTTFCYILELQSNIAISSNSFWPIFTISYQYTRQFHFLNFCYSLVYLCLLQ